jgi:hydroxypyruvate reductase
VTLRTAVEAAIREALAELDPARLVAHALTSAPAPSGRVRVIAVGKASFAMTAGALTALGPRLDDALAIGTDGLDDAALRADRRVTVLRARHPLPDERSLRAGEEALRRASELGPGDTLVALISGGASALLAAPAPPLELDDEIALADDMLRAGAPIGDVNVVRRHVSRVRGGGLARAAGAARVLTLLLSDVVGGAPHEIGSGPTVADPTTRADALDALRRHAPARLARVAPALTESLEPGERADPPPVVLASPESLAAAIARALRARGFDAAAADAEGGPADEVARRRLDAACALAPGHALVVPCEPTVRLPARHGRGGRAGRVALLAGPSLPREVALACVASDGVDGSSGTAGAIVTRASFAAATRAAIDAALADYDDAALHRALGTALELGPTGTNLTDVHVLVRSARA